MSKQWTFVTSANIEAVAFKQITPGAETGEMHIRFKNGRIYVYYGVGTEIYDQFLKAESQGKFFHAHIKNNFTYNELQ